MGLFGALLQAGLSGSNPQPKKKRNPSWAGNTDLFADPHSPEFIDYRDKRSSYNDHNWDADGDVRWDSYE